MCVARLRGRRQLCVRVLLHAPGPRARTRTFMSSSDSSKVAAPRLSFRWAMRLAPTIGAVTPGFCMSHRSETWAGERPKRSPISQMASMMFQLVSVFR